MRHWFMIFALLIPMSAMATGVEVSGAIDKKIRAAIPDLHITGIRTTPMKGIYELKIKIGTHTTVYYSDADGKHLIAGGHMFETATHRDITRERLEELNRVDWSLLPLDKAIVSGDPKAKLQVAIFTDPECPYCRKLESEIKDMKGVKVYTFLFPLTQIHQHALDWSEAIWCSKDRHDTMMKIMLDGANPAAGTCDTPIADIQQLAIKLGITGTPTLISGDGRMFAGVKSADQLKAWLASK